MNGHPRGALCAVDNEERDVNVGCLKVERSFMVGRLDLGLPGWRELVKGMRRGCVL